MAQTSLEQCKLIMYNVIHLKEILKKIWEIWINYSVIIIWYNKSHLFLIGVNCYNKNTCLNGATCSDVPGGGIKCICKDGYTGKYCQTG